MFFPINAIIFLAVILGVVFLQIFLSKKKSRWFGLILPTVCLLFSIIAVLGVQTFFYQEKLTLEQIAPDGTVLEEAVTEQQSIPVEDIGTAIFRVIIVFLLYNIPTAILLIIYFACREKIKQRSLLDKMTIQDLE